MKTCGSIVLAVALGICGGALSPSASEASWRAEAGLRRLRHQRVHLRHRRAERQAARGRQIQGAVFGRASAHRHHRWTPAWACSAITASSAPTSATAPPPGIGRARRGCARDGSVEVRWPSAEDRPFELRALYRWAAPDTLDLETSVQAKTNLAKFESFLASYFAQGFTNACVYARSNGRRNW